MDLENNENIESQNEEALNSQPEESLEDSCHFVLIRQ